MNIRQIIYSGAIIVLGFIQMSPCLLILGSTIIAVLLGIIYTLMLGYFWSSTIIGKWFFREMWSANLRLEKFLLGDNG